MAFFYPHSLPLVSRRRRRKDVPHATSTRNLSDLLYPTLDLHGKTEAEAKRAVRHWLKEIRAAGEPIGRVITGRGLHSKGPAVLPASVEALLAELKGTLVQGYEREPGGGAYRVRLRRAEQDRTPPKPTGPAAIASPELIRRAEETLAELGITPTPSLVEAEVRRILAERG